MDSNAPSRLPLSSIADIGILEDGCERTVPVGELCARLEVEALIRLHGEDFDLLGRDRSGLMHFNLEFTSNKVGKRYAVVPIIRAGQRRTDGSEILPVIDPTVARRAVCTEVVQHLPLHKVTAVQFAESLPNIRSMEELGAALYRRYGRMFPDQTTADLLRRGCALTRLTFLNE